MRQAFFRGFLSLALLALIAPAMAGTPEPAVDDPVVVQPTVITEDPELTKYVSVFGGVITDEDFQDVLFEPWDIEFLGSQIVGFAFGIERPTRWANFDIGAEVQLAKWFGNQTHWELNAMPVVGRYRFNGRAGFLRSVSFGLGLSYATEEPEEEIIDDGETNKLLVYWSAELEFGRADWDYTPFFKVHHRSNAFGLIEEDAGSNTLALGLRRRF